MNIANQRKQFTLKTDTNPGFRKQCKNQSS